MRILGRSRPMPCRHGGSNAAVILASPNHAVWLEDTDFMSSFLRRCSFNLARDGDDSRSRSRDVSVLAAVVDGLCPTRRRGLPASGLSVLYGQLDDILPGMWDASHDSPAQRTALDVPHQSSISVALSPLLGDSRCLKVALPLANTVFQNGRRSTLLASRWLSDGAGDPYELVALAERQSQDVVPSFRSIQTYTSVAVPLVPVTRPRKIVAGLGNIVRQVDVDGEPSPASRELEAAIPRLLEARSKSVSDVPAAAAGPIAVWALVLPPEAMDPDVIQDLAVVTDYHHESEHEVAERVSRSFSKLLVSGCHLHKICESPPSSAIPELH